METPLKRMPLLLAVERVDKGTAAKAKYEKTTRAKSAAAKKNLK